MPQSRILTSQTCILTLGANVSRENKILAKISEFKVYYVVVSQSKFKVSAMTFGSKVKDIYAKKTALQIATRLPLSFYDEGCSYFAQWLLMVHECRV